MSSQDMQRLSENLIIRVILALLSLANSTAHATANHDCLKSQLRLHQLGEKLEVTDFDSDGNSLLNQNQKDFLNHRLLPITGKRAFISAVVEKNPCRAGTVCVDLAPIEGSKSLRIEWYVPDPHSGTTGPEIVANKSGRVLRIPNGLQFESLPDQGSDIIHHFLMGHPLHPYIALPHDRIAVGEAPLVYKPSQREAIAAASAGIERGDRSFLFVAPTGLGKTEVLTSVLEKQLQRKDTGKLHILLVDQVQLGDQLSESVDTLRAKINFDLVRWGGDQKSTSISELVKSARSKDTPTVLVTTIQSLKARVKAEPENEALLREVLGTLMFDEVHHAGAEQARDLIQQLIYDKNSRGLFYGTTATPMHSDIPLIESLFGNRAFWANLDTAESYLKKSGNVERSIEEVVDQLAISLRKGELTPIHELRFVEPQQFARGDEKLFVRQSADGETARYSINPAYYDELVGELKPSLLKHKKGFITVSTIDEARAIQELLDSEVPERSFAAFHSQMPKEEQAEILRKFKRGEIRYLVTVKKLDEGVNVPDMTLFIDLNRSTGPRQLLQRWGRVLRLFPNKEGVDILTFFEADESHIREKLALIEAILRGDFEPRWSAPSPTVSKNRQTLLKIQDHLKRKQEEISRTNKWTPVRAAEDLIDFYENHARLPKTRTPGELGAYQRLHLYKDHPEFLEALEEEPGLWSLVADLTPRKKRYTLGANGPEASAEFLNLFVREVSQKEGKARLPNEDHPGLSNDEMNREGALVRRIKSYAENPKLLENASPELIQLLNERKNLLETIKTRKTRVRNESIAKVTEPAPVATPTPVQLDRASKKAEERYIHRTLKNESYSAAQAKKTATQQTLQANQDKTLQDALRLVQTRRDLRSEELKTLERARAILKQKQDAQSWTAVNERIGKELERLKQIKAQAALLELTPSETKLIQERLRFHPRGQAEFNALPQELRMSLRKKTFQTILGDPARSGIYNDWSRSGVKTWSVKLNFQSKEYRVIYNIRDGHVEILLIGSADDVIRNLRPRLEHLK